MSTHSSSGQGPDLASNSSQLETFSLRIIDKSDIEDKKVPKHDLWFLWLKDGPVGPYLGDDLLRFCFENSDFSLETKIARYGESNWTPLKASPLNSRLQSYERKMNKPDWSQFPVHEIFVLIKGQKMGPYSGSEIAELVAHHEILLSQLISLDHGETWIRLGEHNFFNQARHLSPDHLPPAPDDDSFTAERKNILLKLTQEKNRSKTKQVTEQDEKQDQTNKAKPSPKSPTAFPMLNRSLTMGQVIPTEIENPSHTHHIVDTNSPTNTKPYLPHIEAIQKEELIQQRKRKFLFWGGLFMGLTIIIAINLIPSGFEQKPSNNLSAKINKQEILEEINKKNIPRIKSYREIPVNNNINNNNIIETQANYPGIVPESEVGLYKKPAFRRPVPLNVNANINGNELSPQANEAINRAIQRANQKNAKNNFGAGLNSQQGWVPKDDVDGIDGDGATSSSPRPEDIPIMEEIPSEELVEPQN